MSPQDKSLRFKLESTSLTVDAAGRVELPPAAVSVAGDAVVWPRQVETRAEVQGSVKAQVAERVEKALKDAYRWPAKLSAAAPLDQSATSARSTGRSASR
jgi:hypothetical protein